MGYVLDSIIKFTMIEQESVSADFTSDPFDISGSEFGFSIQASLDNGNSPNMVFSLEVSTDGINYATLTNSDQTFTDTDGSILWDVISTQISFVRVHVQVTSGSVDIVECIISAKRRH